MPETRQQIIREWLTGLLLPIAIFYYTYKKDVADDDQRKLDRVAAIIRSLGSSSSPERALARRYISYLAQHEQVPPEAVELLANNASTASTATEAVDAINTLETVRKKDAALAPTVQKAVNDLPVRLYLQIRDQKDRGTAERLQKLLSGNGLVVPGIELVNVGPTSTEVRYFHPEDKDKAEEITKKLVDAGVPTIAKNASNFAKLLRSNVPLHQLELWIAPDAKLTKDIGM